jgi:hypothetical protein
LLTGKEFFCEWFSFESLIINVLKKGKLSTEVES